MEPPVNLLAGKAPPVDTITLWLLVMLSSLKSYGRCCNINTELLQHANAMLGKDEIFLHDVKQLFSLLGMLQLSWMPETPLYYQVKELGKVKQLTTLHIIEVLAEFHTLAQLHFGPEEARLKAVLALRETSMLLHSALDPLHTTLTEPDPGGWGNGSSGFASVAIVYKIFAALSGLRI